MKAFVQGQFICIDIVMPDGRSQIERETLEQIQARYPGAVIADLDTWTAAKERALCTEPVEITKERFIEMLEVLPPQRWQISPQFESFEMCEHTSGRITEVYCRLGKKFFTYTTIAGQPLEAHIVKCKSTEPAEAPQPKCAKCGGAADDGEGYDGLCGACADIASKRIL